MSDETLSRLARALDATGRVVDAVTTDQWTAATPCTDWTSADLLRHLVVGNSRFAAAVSGEPAANEIGPDADLPAAYRESAAALLAAFGAPGALERIVTVPFGTVPGSVALHLRVTEVLVHGWDLAQATGQPADFPADAAEHELAFSQSALEQLPPDRRPFAPPQPVSPDAPAIERLVACLGRSVTAPA
ncbi:MAG TPA: TIGR03086 family metal-binding protein [Streptosporangiaceae bacterium]|nr:TIGR03086 family metal-binding protein [Streptosporangiaceae bacterium]